MPQTFSNQDNAVYLVDVGHLQSIIRNPCLPCLAGRLAAGRRIIGIHPHCIRIVMLYLKPFITILAWVLFLKLALFWLWLWQLKNYHWARFRAHFETQVAKKIASSFWRLKRPVATKKMLVIVFVVVAAVTAFLLSVYAVPLKTLLVLETGLIILAPVITSIAVFLFQVPTILIQRRILEKARQKREQFPNLTVIGITGSYGKSSTKEFLAQILSEKFRVLKTQKNINAEIGIAQTILSKLKSEHDIFVAEIGAYERGKIKQVCMMLQPQIGILTGINEQHMSTFGSQENIIKAKCELIENLNCKRKSLPVFNRKDNKHQRVFNNCLAVFNGNNKYCEELYKKTKIPKKLVSPTHNTFWRIRQNVLPWDRENLAMAKAVAEELGMIGQEIKKAIQKVKPSLTVKQGIGGLKIINSTYSVNPNGILSHLDYINNLPGKKILVMPCLIELGRAAKRVHYKIGQRIGRVCDLAIITTPDYFKQLKQGALEKGMEPGKILFLKKSAPILERIKDFTIPGDLILLESRVSEQVINTLQIQNLNS